MAIPVETRPGEVAQGYRELARHYGFKVEPTPVRQPKKKGKVEAGVRYVKRNGLAGLASNADLDAAGAHLARWIEGIANQRIHGTTQRRPAEVFAAEERSALMPLPAVPFVPVIWHAAGVHQDAHVAFGGRLYSVPWRLIKQRVWLPAGTRRGRSGELTKRGGSDKQPLVLPARSDRESAVLFRGRARSPCATTLSAALSDGLDSRTRRCRRLDRAAETKVRFSLQL